MPIRAATRLKTVPAVRLVVMSVMGPPSAGLGFGAAYLVLACAFSSASLVTPSLIATVVSDA